MESPELMRRDERLVALRSRWLVPTNGHEDNASDVVQNPGVSRLVETHRRKAPDSSEWSPAELVVFFIKNEGAPILTPAH
jgi:hypothetical protein